MKPCSMRLRCFAILCLPASIAATLAAQAGPEVSSPASAPVAFVYVATNPANSSTNQLEAFSAAADGRLTPVAGSPYAEDVTNMAVNGKYLFASTNNGIYIDQFQIESAGNLHFIRATNVLQYNQNDCGRSGTLVFDHTGSSLYDIEVDGDCANNVMQSFNVERPSGQLQNLGGTGASRQLNGLISFTGNNQWAYTTACYPGFGYSNYAFHRTGNGALKAVNTGFTLPAAPAGSAWCPDANAADPANHVAITMQPAVSPEQPYTFTPTGPPQIAAYTADAAGNLTTTNTRQNMPATAVETVIDINMAPSGKLLAVGGTKGLQLFHFNGAAPPTHYTDLLAKEEIQQIFWDNANHVYALGLSRLYVFTATPASVVQAPGSPYTLGPTVSLIVQPRTAKPAYVK